MNPEEKGVLPHLVLGNNTGPSVAHQFRGIDANGSSRWFNVGYNAESKYLSFSGEGGATVFFSTKVGIGTTTPDAKLTVAGKIHSQEVKVTIDAGTGPDYVFEEDYDLRSLEETAAYIRANKHLPEVPTAIEMETNGVHVGEMNMLLLKKVEELTLHLIAVNKEKEELEKRINEVNRELIQKNKQFSSLEKQMKEIEQVVLALGKPGSNEK